MTRKLIITIDMTRWPRPTADDLREYKFVNEADYWIDYAYSDPVGMFDGATWQLVDDQEATR